MLNMSDVKFDISPVGKKPKRMYRKGSKYDPILEAFLESSYSLVEVVVEGLEGNYLRMQLKKRIDAREFVVTVSAVNGRVFLEK